ncbi:MAG: hypothetical protein GY856_52060 [bacterium]|nr:hypothetical protein [bacterium]
MRINHLHGSRIALVLLAGLLVAGIAPAQSTGSADLSRYVALGDSLGAGFMAGSLLGDVQQVSYPALLTTQVHGSASGFELPLVSAPGIPGALQLVSLSPLVIAPAAGMGLPTNIALPRPYDNLSVPGADLKDVLETVTDFGGLHDLILRGLGTQLQQALMLEPTFATFWVNNDALAAAVSGVVIDDVTLTSLDSFESRYRTITDTLAAAGVQMALATIPDVTTIPYVTTLPPVVINPATNEPVLVNGNYVQLIGPDGPLYPGQDFVLLTASAEMAAGKGIPVELGGSGEPLSDLVVLSGSEVAAITARVAGFNQVIRAVAGERGAALVDINTFFAGVAAHGMNVGGIEFTADFLTGGLFSYDGVHPTPFGYAIVANEFIRAINQTYGADIPPVGYYDYIYGPLASLGTGFPVGSSFVFTPKAAKQLSFALGIPDRKTLNRIKKRRAAAD